MLTAGLLALSAALLCAVAPAAGEAGGARRRARSELARPEPPPLSFRYRARIAAGGFDGETVRRDRGGLAAIELAGTALLSRKELELELPLRFSHRRTFGSSLDETRGKAGLQLQWEPGRSFKLKAGAALAGAHRPSWPDLYQPLPAGGFEPTSRFSFASWEAGGELAARPVARHWARLGYRFVSTDYRADPNFDEIDEPMHLTPWDNGQHELRASWRYVGKSWRPSVAVEAFERQDYFLFARDAGTGKTHSGPGGLPPNPLQRLRGVEPMAELEVEALDERLEVTIGYGYERAFDLFQGYYSFAGHHPKLQLSAKATENVSARLGVDGWLREYGPDSYAAGPGHPPLRFGDRLVERRARLNLEVRRHLGAGLSALAQADLRLRESNYPDYVPGVFPATREYSVQWTYSNWATVVGIEYSR